MTTPTQYTPGMLGDQMLAQQQTEQQMGQQHAARVAAYQRSYKTKLMEYQQTLENQKQQKPGGLQGLFAAGVGKLGDLWNKLPDTITHPTEEALSGLYWAYSRFISQPVSFTVLLAREAIHDDDDESWASVRELWKDAKHMSPGQSLVSLAYSEEQLKERGIDFDRNIYDKSWFKEGSFFEGGWSWQKFISGSLDFAVAWYADPFVIGGKGVGKVRQQKVVREVSKMPELARTAEGALVNPTAYQDMMKSDAFTSIMGLVERYKVKHGDNAGTFLARDMKMVREMPNGGAFIDLLARSRNREEMADVLRIGIGDRTKVAELATKNEALGVEMLNLSRQVDAMNLYTSTAVGIGPRIQQSINRMLQQKTDEISAIKQQLDSPMAKVDDLNDYLNTLNKLYYNSHITPVTTAIRGAVLGVDKGYRIPDNFNTGNRFVDNLVVKPVAATVYNGLFVTPVKVIRAFMDKRPPLFLAHHEENAWKGVDAALANVRTRDGFEADQAFRNEWVTKYQRATPAERAIVARQMEEAMIERMALSFGTANEATGLKALYQMYAGIRSKYTSSGTQPLYSVGTVTRHGEEVNVAAVGPDGASMVVHPIFKGQLEQSYVLTDFNDMAKIARRDGQKIGRVLNKAHPYVNTAVDVADWFMRMFKFSKVFSVAYGIRTVTDDVLSMTTRFGAATMMGANKAHLERYIRGRWADDPVEAEMVALGYNNIEVRSIDAEIRRETAKLERAQGTPRAAMIERNIADSTAYRDELLAEQAQVVERIRAAKEAQMVDVDGVKFHPAMDDPLFRMEASSSRSNARFMGGNQTQQMRALRGDTTSDVGSNVWRPVNRDQPGFDDAWLRSLYLVQDDALAQIYLRGGDDAAMRTFLRSPEGKAWAKGMPRRSMDERIEVHRAAIDELIPPAAPWADGIRQQLIAGEIDAHSLAAIEQGSKPMQVAEELTKFNLGSTGDSPAGLFGQAIDKFMDGFYHLVNTAPTDALIRNPMANALYRSHLEDLVKQQGARNVEKFSNADLLRMENIARQRTLQDVKGFSFSMDSMSQAAWAMRFMAPFFGAKIEGFQRWGRVLMERPQVVGRAGTLFNAPLRAGDAYDRDGNKLNADGTVTDPVTGEKRMVPKGDRVWRIQLPSWYAKGLEKATGVKLTETEVSIDSMNLTLQDDPVWLPSWGPVVQVPAKFLSGDDPETMSTLKELGILPLGSATQAKVGDIFSGPSWLLYAGKAVGQYMDSSSSNNDAVAVMRQMDLEYRMGLRSKKPTFEEARSKSRKFSVFKAISKLISPASTQYEMGIEIDEDAEGVASELRGATKPIQFFLDEYRRMQDSKIPHADQAFLDKYGESFFAITVSMSRNNTGVGATQQAVDATRRYKGILDQVDPDLHALIVGAEGIGPFSQEAYYYQLNTETRDGSGKTQRERMSPLEYQKELDRRSGWNMFSKTMKYITSQMIDQGFTSFEEKGAEDFANMKRGLIAMLSSPELPNGDPNPNYSRAWEEDWNQQDMGFYDRRIQDLTVIANSPQFDPRLNPMRADIRGLKEYLLIRDAVTTELDARDSLGGSADLSAKANSDLLLKFRQAVFSISERNIAFGELHDRYLARDMGVDMPWEV